MAAVGNKLANDYYEYRMPSSLRKLDETSSNQQCAKFIQEKYVKKIYCPPNYPSPVKEFLENKEKGVKPDVTVEEYSSS
jgi:hypothetical protein